MMAWFPPRLQHIADSMKKGGLRRLGCNGLRAGDYSE